MKQIFLIPLLFFLASPAFSLPENLEEKSVPELKKILEETNRESSRQLNAFGAYINANKPLKMSRAEADQKECRKNLDGIRLVRTKNDPEFIMAQWKLFRADETLGRIGTECRLEDPEWFRHHAVFCKAHVENEFVKQVLSKAVAQEAQRKECIRIGSEKFQVFLAPPGVVKSEPLHKNKTFDFCGSVFQILINGKPCLQAPGLMDGIVASGKGSLLRKSGEDGKNTQKFPINSMGKTLIKRNGTSVSFTRIQPDCDGRSYELCKKYSIDPLNKLLLISYSLKNTGTKELVCEQYNLNSLFFGPRIVGSRYLLRPEFEKGEWSGTKDWKDGEFIWDRPIVKTRNGFVFQHRDSGLKIEIRGDFPASRFRIFRDESGQIHPVVFFAIRLDPGHSLEWTRSYRFLSE